MRRAASQPLLRHFQESEGEKGEDDEEEKRFRIKAKELRGNIDSSTSKHNVTCMTLHRPKSKKPNEEAFSWQKYASWSQEQKSGAAKLKKQLKARWATDGLIEKQLSQFKARYNPAVGPTKMSDVAQLLIPRWAPANELAAISWLGDWRPTLILELVRSSLSRSITDSEGVERRALSQLINDVRIEEAVIDEEMTEIQAKCVLSLPFGHNKNNASKEPLLANIKSEFKKIHRVIAKAQNLRMKALELAVKRVLSQTDAAEFLVELVGIQDAIHQYAVKHKSSKGCVCIKELQA